MNTKRMRFEKSMQKKFLDFVKKKAKRSWKELAKILDVDESAVLSAIKEINARLGELGAPRLYVSAPVPATKPMVH